MIPCRERAEDYKESELEWGICCGCDNDIIETYIGSAKETLDLLLQEAEREAVENPNFVKVISIAHLKEIIGRIRE